MTMYFIAVVLPEEINAEVLEWKKFMAEKYNCRVGLKSPAHITIVAPFWPEEGSEEQLIADVNSISGDVVPFPLATADFSAFRPRTIFIAVQPSEPLQQLKKAADDFFCNREFYHIKKENRPFHPHITIATRDLFKKDFYDSWPRFEKESFVKEWIAGGLSLLRHNKRSWDVIHTAPFKSL